MSYGFGKEEFENEELVEKWSWSLKNSWAQRLGSPPVELVDSADYSRSWEMDRAHIFRLENGEYALIVEQGCSCYTADWADIQLHPDEEKAVKKFREWKKTREQRSF